MGERKEKRDISFLEALILVAIFVVIFVLASGRFPTGMAILLCAMVSAAYGVIVLKIEWDKIYKNILAMFSKGMSAVIILLMVGLISASWLASGTIPALVIMGLKTLTPGTFLVAAFIACAVVSIATGSSWTTCATVGVALMGVANGIGVPVGIAGGAIVSGCWIGDKWSPLSDTTNLGAAMTGEDVIDVWKKMLPTSGIGGVAAAVIFAVMGLRYAGSGMDKEKIQFLVDGISSQYKINLVLLLIPIIVVVVLAAKKKPVLPVLVLGVVLALGIAVFYQGKDPGQMLNALYNGYVTDTGVAEIDKLLTGGGMLDMMGIMLIIFCAFILAGTLESVGVMNALISKMGKITGNRGTLVLSSYISAVLCTYLGGTAYTGIVLNTGMFEKPYEDAGMDKLTMVRSLLEGSGHTNALVPWCGSHVLIVSTLGITFRDFLPFYYSFWISSILLIIYGFTGWFMQKKS
ncbi:Na+/H+ antiporter NhaC family protein [Roseburia hominis]